MKIEYNSSVDRSIKLQIKDSVFHLHWGGVVNRSLNFPCGETDGVGEKRIESQKTAYYNMLADHNEDPIDGVRFSAHFDSEQGRLVRGCRILDDRSEFRALQILYRQYLAIENFDYESIEDLGIKL